MWPLLSLSLAAVDGKNDNDLIAYAEKTTQENPGTEKLMNYLIENFDGLVYLITSSYPAVGLKIAEKYDIPFKQVFTNGFPPSRKILSQKDFVTEVKERSPMRVLSEHKKKVGSFLHEYLDICNGLGKFYDVILKEKRLQQNYYDEKTEALHLSVKALIKEHSKLFENINDFTLRNTLECLFSNEKCVIGSHRKVDAIRSVHDRKGFWAYAGDGIVDGMPIDYADYGISINMTNGHALSFSKLNIATTDTSKLIPVFDAMLNGKFGSKLKESLDSEEIRVFTSRDIQQDIENVIKVNRDRKNKLKASYVPV